MMHAIVAHALILNPFLLSYCAEHVTSTIRPKLTKLPNGLSPLRPLTSQERERPPPTRIDPLRQRATNDVQKWTGFQSYEPFLFSYQTCHYTVPNLDDIDLYPDYGSGFVMSGESIFAYCDVHQWWLDGSTSQFVPEIKRGNVFGKECNSDTYQCTNWWASEWHIQAVYFFTVEGRSHGFVGPNVQVSPGDEITSQIYYGVDENTGEFSYTLRIWANDDMEGGSSIVVTQPFMGLHPAYQGNYGDTQLDSEYYRFMSGNIWETWNLHERAQYPTRFEWSLQMEGVKQDISVTFHEKLAYNLTIPSVDQMSRLDERSQLLVDGSIRRRIGNDDFIDNYISWILTAAQQSCWSPTGDFRLELAIGVTIKECAKLVHQQKECGITFEFDTANKWCGCGVEGTPNEFCADNTEYHSISSVYQIVLPELTPSPTPNPIMPPTSVPTTNGGPSCFSGESTILVKDKGPILMKNLQIGDMVQSGVGEFSRVYSFGHYSQQSKAEYLQIYTTSNSGSSSTPLEISKDHMVFVRDMLGPVPASAVSVGDYLLALDYDSYSFAKVTKINTVDRVGAFAPFTNSGTIMVSGVLASNYVSLQEESGSMMIGITKIISMHWIAHTLQAPHRLYCSTTLSNNDICSNESYTKEGISHWVYGPLIVSKWMLRQHIAVMGILSLWVVLIGLAFSAFELVFHYVGTTMLLTALVTFILFQLKMNKRKLHGGDKFVSGEQRKLCLFSFRGI